VRENRTHGSEGGDGESRSRPLSTLTVLPTTLRSKLPGIDPKEIKKAMVDRLLIRAGERARVTVVVRPSRKLDNSP
jgi:hypothetical protein